MKFVRCKKGNVGGMFCLLLEKKKSLGGKMWAVKYSSLYHLKYGGGYRNEKKKYCTRDISGLKIFNQTGISTKCHTSSNRLLRKLFVDAC